MPLKKQEVTALEASGTELHQIADELWAGKPKPGFRKKYYQLDSDCGNLNQITNMCTDYTTRPDICREFTAGTLICSTMKQRQVIRQMAPVEIGMPTMRKLLGDNVNYQIY